MIRWFTFVSLLIMTTVVGAAPTIMVTLKPFYNITYYIMQNVGMPQLLLKNNASPHDYHLRPSDAKLISDADLIIWGGVNLEPYMQKPIESMAKANLDLSKTPGLKLLPQRCNQDWAHDHNHEHQHDANYDPHYWLDPDNAIIIASNIADKLAEIDKAHADIYHRNAKNFAAQLRTKEKTWQTKLLPYQDDPYIVGHDAFQYFNEYFDLDGVGSITLNPELPPSAKHIQELQAMMHSKQITCIFGEPQFNYKIINTLLVGTNTNFGILDPLGQDQDTGAKGYFILLDNIVNNFVQCSKNP